MVNNLQIFAKKFTKSFLSSLCGIAGIKNLQAARADNASINRFQKLKMVLEIFDGNVRLPKISQINVKKMISASGQK